MISHAPGRRHQVLATFAVALCALTVAVPRARGAVQISNGLVAYWDDQVKQIFSRTLDGTQIRQLTFPPGQAAQPAFSPDGRTIAYSHAEPGTNAEIWRMDPDGTNKRRLARSSDALQDPSWSLDGSRIAYDRSGRGGSIWVMNSDGSKQRRVSNDPDVQMSSPAFSPDGVNVAFSGVRTDGSASTYGIFTLNLATGQQREITANAFDEHQGGAPITDEVPAYSPDGRMITFNRCEVVQCSVFVVDSDGHAPHQVTPPEVNGIPVDTRDPAFSGDSRQIIFSAYLGRHPMFPEMPPQLGPYLFVVNSDGSGLAPLPNSQGATNPSWQPRYKLRAGCRGRGHLIAGTVGPNLMRGSSRRDVIDGGGGRDRVRGLTGADTLCGGRGRDRLVGGPGRDKLVGGPGRDVLIGGPGKDKFVSQPGDVVRP